MPKAPRDRHCARSFSTVASTASMVGRALGNWPGESSRKDSHSADRALVRRHEPALSTCLLTWPATVLESRQPLLWLLPVLPSVGSASCLAGLLLRDGGSGDWEGPQL